MKDDHHESKFPAAHNCHDCLLRDTPGMVGRGVIDETTGRVNVLIIGEGPGREEVRKKQVFIGPSGALLYKTMRSINLGSSFWLTNAALCAGKDAKEKRAASLCCEARLRHKIAELKPRIIMTLGNIPTDILLGKGEGITARRGSVNKVQITEEFSTIVVPTVHPAAVLRNNNWLTDFESDFMRVSRMLFGKYEVRLESKEVEYTVTADYPMVLAEAERSVFAVLDVETTGLDMTRDRLLCAVVATDWHVYIIEKRVMYSPWFANALEHCTARWSGHNAKFDRNFLIKQIGCYVDFAYDSMLAHYLFDERQGNQGLKNICRRLWSAPDWEAPVRSMLKRREIKDYGDLPLDLLYKYAAHDGYWQRRLTIYTGKLLLKDKKKKWVFDTLLMPGSHALSQAEVRGVKVDQEALEPLQKRYEEVRKAKEMELVRIAGRQFNARSPKQVAEVMFDTLKLPQLAGRSTAAKTVLLRYPFPRHPFVEILLDFRAVNTLLTRYINGLAKNISPDGYVHSSFSLSGTVTGRLSSSKPNLQNQPSRVPSAKKDIRDLFIAEPGDVWCDCDFSQLEYRMIAVLSQDPYLLQCYKEGKDFHAEMAEMIWGPDWTKANRTDAKGINFGLAYGRSVKGIMSDGTLDIDYNTALRVASTFFKRMPGVVRFNAETRGFVKTHRYVETPLGRVRRFPEVALAKNEWQMGRIYREAINMLPQSTASDATLFAFINLCKKGFDVRITVHDSIVVSAPADQAEYAARNQMRIMSESAAELFGDQIPFPTDAQIGKRWGSLKELELEEAE